MGSMNSKKMGRNSFFIAFFLRTIKKPCRIRGGVVKSFFLTNENY
jgi:hypothetical protein